jgi:TolB-like protein/Tfp pilus assembly protein PilF
VELTAYELALKAQALFYDGVAATDPEILDRAEAEIDAVLRLDPRNVHGLWTKSLIDLYRHVFRWGEDPDGALASCAETTDILMQIDSSNAQVYMVRAWSHLYRGNFDAALADHRRALALNPNLALNLFAMAWSEAVAGLTDEAREHAHMALRLSPRDADIWRGEAYSALALVSFYEGDFAETVKWAHLANQMQPVNQGMLAAAHAYLGDLEAARSHARALEAFAPDFLHAVLSGKVEVCKSPEVEVCKSPEHNRLFIEGLRKAGLTEGGDDPAGGPLPLPDKPSIAVLPFENISGDKDQERFADGIMEEIITTLSKVSKLFVIARNSMLVYKGQAVDIRQVAREQGVQYVLEGSVRRGGERLRVTAQLIEAETGRHVWAQRYDRAFEDVLALQDDLTKEIVSALQVELTAGEQARIAAQGTKNPEAWQLTFEGRDLVHAHHKDSVQKGKRLLEQAVGLDETYALAWDALSEAYWKEARNAGWSASPERSFERAVEASDRALALDPENADALAMRSVIMVTQREFDGALALAEKAFRVAHSNANAIALAAITLYACGKAEDAIRQTELAMRHCPRYPPWYPLMLARCHWMLGHGDQALAAARATLEADPEFSLPYVVLAMLHAEAGRDSEARDAVDALLRIDPTFSASTHMRGLPMRDPETDARARAALRKAGVPD